MSDTSPARWVVRDATASDILELIRMQQAMARETEGIKLDPALVEKGPFEQPNLAKYFVAIPTDGSGEPAGMLGITYEWSDRPSSADLSDQ
jgi:hypothetical protein